MDQNGQIDPLNQPTVQPPATPQPLPPQDSPPFTTPPAAPLGTGKPPRRKLLWLVLILIALFGGYVAVDALTDTKLPYEFFKKTAPISQTTTPSAIAPSTQDAVFQLPANWTWYENKDLGFKFAYPQAWGTVKIEEWSFGGVVYEAFKGGFAISFSNQKLAKAGVLPRVFEWPAREFSC